MRGVNEIKLFFPFRILRAQVFPKPITTFFSFFLSFADDDDVETAPRQRICALYSLLTMNV